MRFYLNTEFIEYPRTIDLISIGLVAEDGREYYAISNEYDQRKASDWVMDNVFTKLPNKVGRYKDQFKSLEQIRDDILEFVGDDRPEFWGYYCDYDWVVFCWLFGSMVDLPNNFPMQCNDLIQWANQLVCYLYQEEASHHALEDARWIRDSWNVLAKIEAERGITDLNKINLPDIIKESK